MKEGSQKCCFSLSNIKTLNQIKFALCVKIVFFSLQAHSLTTEYSTSLFQKAVIFLAAIGEHDAYTLYRVLPQTLNINQWCRFLDFINIFILLLPLEDGFL